MKMYIDYATKNTFTLRDEDGDATYITGKGKSAQTLTETILPTLGDYGWYYWDVHAGAADDLIDARASSLNAYLYGDAGNDTIYGSQGFFNHIEGGDGNDLIDASMVGSLESYPSGYTELLGGSGTDTIYGGWGEDFIDGGAGRDIINAGDGYDRVVYDASDIKVEGDGGFDTIDASSAAATNVRSGKGVTIDLSSNRDIFYNFEAVIGSKYNDTLTGDNASNRFDGGDGNDIINAGGGYDFVVYDAKDTSVDGGFDWDVISGEDASVGMNLDLTTTHRNFEEVQGSRFDDTIKGDSNRNDIYANSGNDVIYGGAGLDYISGGDGDDYIDGGAGEDNINPGYGNDTWVYDAADYVYESSYDEPYEGGVDTIDASTALEAVTIDMSYYYYLGFENLIGSAYGDSLMGNGKDNVIEGGAGADLIDGGGYSDLGDTASYAGSSAGVTVNLGTGAGTGGDAEGDLLSNIQNLLGSQWADALTGDSGINWLEGGAGADQLDGGDVGEGDLDYASYARSAAGLMVSLANPGINTGDAAGDLYTDIAGLIGSSFDDILIGDEQDNIIVDGMFDYTSYYWVYGKGDDWIDGGAGVDRIYTGAGNDTVVYDVVDFDVRDEGDVDPFGYHVNTIDTVDASSSGAGVTIDLNSSYYGFDIVIGSGFADTLTGNYYDNVIEGGAGADTINGGEDSFSFGDSASYAGSGAAVSVDLGLGTATGGDAEGDTFVSIENLIGSAYADTLTGDSGDNVLEGGAGGDLIDGGLGSDSASYIGSAEAVTVDLGLGTASGGDAAGDTLTSIENLIGSAFDDTLNGDTGDNRLEGSGGADVMDGGSGQDTYVYKSIFESVEGQMDAISGFEWGTSGDFIDFSALLGSHYYNYGVYETTPFADFAELKAEALTQLQWEDVFVGTDGTDTYVFMNDPNDYNHVSGDDMVIKLAGVNDLSGISADNFLTGGMLFLDPVGY
jgi:Ca2+-binding RTX toxin-like protein